jgi:hypothetical protein
MVSEQKLLTQAILPAPIANFGTQGTALCSKANFAYFFKKSQRSINLQTRSQKTELPFGLKHIAEKVGDPLSTA